MTLLHGLSLTWNLESIFSGGSESPELANHLGQLETDLATFHSTLSQGTAPVQVSEASVWIDLVDRFQDLALRLRQAGAFVGCLNAQDVNDTGAKVLGGRLRKLGAALGASANLLDGQLLQIPDNLWLEMLDLERLKPIAEPMTERRRRAKEKFDPAVETLVGDLSVDGYHGWSELYDVIVGRMSIQTTENGQTRSLSMGQAHNLMQSGDRAVRADTWQKWDAAWNHEGELCASALNHLGGYRLALYKHRGWDSVLREPLEINRMSQATLDVMWEVITEAKPNLVTFLNRKAKLMGLERLSWFDVGAPLATSEQKVGYDQAANQIIKHFGHFNPEMATFAERAFLERWIEVEDRPGKRPGGFCTGIPLDQESRIFMTFAGTTDNIATLAHELGHAYHGHVMRDLPSLARGYGMNLAETASTFAEMILIEATLRNAQSKEERLALLTDKIGRSVAFFMNIHCRFLFETRFYDARKQGVIPAKRLNEMMLQAQKDAFLDSLDQYDPTFWANKLHFYISGAPFYNWPYTFGYLFSAGLYARALEEGPGFARAYDALLRDTGRMRVEELAQLHLGVDLTQPEFWRSAVGITSTDVTQFLALTED